MRLVQSLIIHQKENVCMYYIYLIAASECNVKLISIKYLKIYKLQMAEEDDSFTVQQQYIDQTLQSLFQSTIDSENQSQGSHKEIDQLPDKSSQQSILNQQASTKKNRSKEIMQQIKRSEERLLEYEEMISEYKEKFRAQEEIIRKFKQVEQKNNKYTTEKKLILDLHCSEKIDPTTSKLASVVIEQEEMQQKLSKDSTQQKIKDLSQENQKE